MHLTLHITLCDRLILWQETEPVKLSLSYRGNILIPIKHVFFVRSVHFVYQLLWKLTQKNMRLSLVNDMWQCKTPGNLMFGMNLWLKLLYKQRDANLLSVILQRWTEKTPQCVGHREFDHKYSNGIFYHELKRITPWQQGQKFTFMNAKWVHKGSLTVRTFSSQRLKSIMVNCSTFAFLLNFSFMKQRKHQSFGI